MDFAAFGSGRNAGLPLPDVVISHQMRAQIDGADFAFTKGNRLEPWQKNMAINGIANTWFRGIADALRKVRREPKPEPVPQRGSCDAQLDFGFGGWICALCVIERVPRHRLGNNLLRLQTLAVQGIQHQRQTGRKVERRDGPPGVHDLRIEIRSLDHRTE